MYILQYIIYTTQVYKGKRKRTITRLFTIIMCTLLTQYQYFTFKYCHYHDTPNVQYQMFSIIFGYVFLRDGLVKTHTFDTNELQ